MSQQAARRGSSRSYVTDTALMADLEVTMTAAVPCRRQACSCRGGRIGPLRAPRSPGHPVLESPPLSSEFLLEGGTCAGSANSFRCSTQAG